MEKVKSEKQVKFKVPIAVSKPYNTKMNKIKDDMDDDDKFFFSERKVLIHESCVLCGMGKCNQRLACAHPTHVDCFIKSNKSPKCNLCESKNIFSIEEL